MLFEYHLSTILERSTHTTIREMYNNAEAAMLDKINNYDGTL